MSNSLNPVFGQWYVGKQIGNGTDGKVFSIYKEKFDGTRETAIMKMIRLGENRNERKTFDLSSGKEEVSDGFDKTIDSIRKSIETVKRADNGRLFVRYEDVELRKASDGKGRLILIKLEEAKSLTEVLKDFTFTLEETYRLGINICQSLQKCRSFGYVYPNLKPENIIFDKEGRCKLGDFGSFSYLEPAKTSISFKRTQYYMAPEFIKTGNINCTCDTYSLGLILYMLSNHNMLPFTEQFNGNVTVNSLNEAMQKRIDAGVLKRPSHASDALWKIIQKACSFKMNDRYFTPDQMLSDLKNALNNQPFDTARFDDVYSGNSTVVGDESVVVPKVEASSAAQEERIDVVAIREEIHIPDAYSAGYRIHAEQNPKRNSEKFDKLIDTAPKSRFDFRGLKRVLFSAFVAICCVMLFVVSIIMSASAAYLDDESSGLTTDYIFNFNFNVEGVLLYGS